MFTRTKRIISVILSTTLMLTVFVPCAFAMENKKQISTLKIESGLRDIFQESNDAIQIGIWLHEPDYGGRYDEIQEQISKDTFLDRSAGELEKLVREKRDIVSNANRIQNNAIAALINDVVDLTYISESAPILHANATWEQVQYLSKIDLIESIFFIDMNLEPSLAISRQVIKADSVQSSTYGGYDGSGINVGMLDVGYPDNSKIGLPSNRITYCQALSSPHPHATLVGAILAGQGINSYPMGIAPGAHLYCAWGIYIDEALDWFHDHDVSIVNVSLVYLDQYGNYTHNEYRKSDAIVDYYVNKQNMNVIIAAGNRGQQGVCSPAMAYNAITVGNVDDNDTVSLSDDILNSYSSYTNSLTPTHASKPDISAPGTDINCGFDSNSGTSLSAPHVTGLIALLAEKDSTIEFVPWLTKAVALSTVNRTKYAYVPSYRIVTTGSTPASSYIQYGAGIIDGLRGLQTVGWSNSHYNYGVLNANTTTVTESIPCTAGQRTRIAVISLNEKTEKNTTNTTVIDYDIELKNPSGNVVATSANSFGNVEIIDYTPTTTGTYTLYIYRNNYVSLANVGYAVAWC